MLKAGVWYIVAGLEGQVRTYRVSRVLGADPIDERFERPEGFDLAAYWAEVDGRLRARRAAGEVVIRIDPAVIGVLADVSAARPSERPRRSRQ